MLITVAGEIDIATAPQLRDRLAALAASGRRLVVDLDRINFLGAAGLNVLADAARQARACGGGLGVVSPRPLVRRLFAITGLDRQIWLARTVTEALAELPPAETCPSTGRTQARTAHPDPGPARASDDMRPVRR